MTRIRVGIVGMGNMGRVHRAAWQQIPNVEVVGCVSQDSPEGIQVYPTIADLVRTLHPDVVSVCTPTDTHPEIVTTLLDSCDVVCEKPLALSSKIAKEISTYAAARQRKLWVAHVLRYFPQYQEITRLIQHGELGFATKVQLRRAVPWPKGTQNWFSDENRSGGVALDLLIHDIDFLVGNFGEPLQVSARRVDSPQFSSLSAILSFPSGVTAQLEGLWGNVAELEFSCQVSARDAMAEFSSRDSAGIFCTMANGERIWRKLPVTQDPYLVQLEAFLHERESKMKTENLDRAITAIRVCEQIALSLKSDLGS